MRTPSSGTRYKSPTVFQPSRTSNTGTLPYMRVLALYCISITITVILIARFFNSRTPVVQAPLSRQAPAPPVTRNDFSRETDASQPLISAIDVQLLYTKPYRALSEQEAVISPNCSAYVSTPVRHTYSTSPTDVQAWKCYDSKPMPAFNLRDQCAEKYREYVDRQFPCRRVYICALLHDNAELLRYWITSMLQLVEVLRPQNVYFSLVESYSADTTTSLLSRFAEHLRSLNVSFIIRSHDISVRRFKFGDQTTNRAVFLAQLRNLAIAPLLELKAEGTTFDYVVFSNDVVFCAGDVLRLMEYDVDVATGYDFFHQDSPSLIINAFYDNWVYIPHKEVAEVVTIDGVVFNLTERRDSRNVPFVHRVCDPGLPCKHLLETPRQAHHAWNGMAVIKADLFYKGLVFRWGVGSECTDCEVQRFLHDLHVTGHYRILTDPTVQLGYSSKSWLYNFRPRHTEEAPLPHLLAPNATIPAGFCDDAARGAYRRPVGFDFADTQNYQKRCCPFRNGSHGPFVKAEKNYLLGWDCYEEIVRRCPTPDDLGRCLNLEKKYKRSDLFVKPSRRALHHP